VLPNSKVIFKDYHPKEYTFVWVRTFNRYKTRISEQLEELWNYATKHKKGRPFETASFCYKI